MLEAKVITQKETEDVINQVALLSEATAKYLNNIVSLGNTMDGLSLKESIKLTALQLELMQVAEDMSDSLTALLVANSTIEAVLTNE